MVSQIVKSSGRYRRTENQRPRRLASIASRVETTAESTELRGHGVADIGDVSPHYGRGGIGRNGAQARTVIVLKALFAAPQAGRAGQDGDGQAGVAAQRD